MRRRSAVIVAELIEPRSAEARPSGRVLLAEDNPINQRVAVAMLGHLGFDVDVMTDGSEAVKAAMRQPYRAILMDCQIPGLDGYQATGQIRRLEKGSRRTPIIAVTGSATEADQQRCLAAGMDDYLAKPLRLKALGDVLSRWAPQAALASSADGRAAREAADRGSPRASGRDVLDAQVVARLERLGAAAGEDLMGQLATLFLADADARVDAMRLALADGDAAAVVRSAHTLSGSSANLGATDLSRLCARLATEGASVDPVWSRDLVAGIEAELARVRSALGLLVAAA
jgi:two-component system, sensor histidine kinase and response regulator